MNTYTGTLYLPKHGRPTTSTTAAGFQLLLPLRDRLGPMRVEPWLAVWTGPEAQAFWQAHQADLEPGTPLAVTLTHLRPHGTAGKYREAPEIHAQVASCTLAPKRWVKPADQPNTNPNTSAHSAQQP